MITPSDIFAVIGWLYLFVALFVFYLAIRPRNTPRTRAIAGSITLIVFGGPPLYVMIDAKLARRQEIARYEKGLAIFEERCKKAGVKVYRVVEDVEGITLQKLRPERSYADITNEMWPGAAFAEESSGEGYIKTFLGHEHLFRSRDGQPIETERGTIQFVKSDRPGYEYVDVKVGDNEFLRYKYRYSKSTTGYLQAELIGEPIKRPSRYSVTFEDIVDKNDRESWIAGSIVQVFDGDEKIAEYTQYAFEHGQGNTDGSRQAWVMAKKCPAEIAGRSSTTRFFVDQVLKPKKEGRS